MQKRLGDVLGIDDSDPEFDVMVDVCGETSSIYTCDEPYWMGEHTWHHDSGRAWQWGTD